MTCLIYIHIGKVLPEYIYDSIYQSVLISPNTKKYVILDDSLINDFNRQIEKFNINYLTSVNCNIDLQIVTIPLSILENGEQFKTYKVFTETLPENTRQYRDSFWISTTARFFYIEQFLKLFKLEKVFHIENDIMIYEQLDNILRDLKHSDLLYFVKDSVERVIPSIIYIPDYKSINSLNKFILKQLKETPHLNDMQLLGKYTTEYFSFNFDDNDMYLFDGAAIGQFLGGVDPRNIPGYQNSKQSKKMILDNPSKGFINETCTFKLDNNNTRIFNKAIYIDNIKPSINSYYCIKKNKLKKIVNLHIHSKQLYQFSSVFNIHYKDIISGDRITSLCDFIITTPEIYNYHQNLKEFFNIYNVIMIKDWLEIDIITLNQIFKEFYQEFKRPIRLFIYTHMFDQFINHVLYKLDTKINYVLYLHNSDHELNQSHFNKLLKYKCIKKVYSQNINCTFNDKFNILPIGLANSMWPHGDTLGVYEIMSKTYYLNKSKNLYININPKTFSYRQTVLNELNNRPMDFQINTTPKPFKDYLHDLSQHFFCLCIRGNGLATHREWEALYLGVIPVFINNKFTNIDKHLVYFKTLNLPFYEITDDNLDKYTDEFFNEQLYKKLVNFTGFTLQNNPALKLNYSKY